MKTLRRRTAGEVSIGMVVGLGIVTVACLAGIICLSSYWSANDYAVGAEANIKSIYDNNQTLLANYSQKVRESAEVPDMARDDAIRLVREAIEGRYGQGGSKADFQAIHEQNPTVDAALYRKLQQIIEAGRDDFASGQTRLRDATRNYEFERGRMWRGLWIRIAGFPKIDLNKYVPITNDYASTTFHAGAEAGPIQLRPTTQTPAAEATAPAATK